MCWHPDERHFHERHHFHPHHDWHRHEHDHHHHHHCCCCCARDHAHRDWREPLRDGVERFGLRRRFLSNKELLEALERYLEELENEAQGVREAIAELKAEMETK